MKLSYIGVHIKASTVPRGSSELERFFRVVIRQTGGARSLSSLTDEYEPSLEREVIGSKAVFFPLLRLVSKRADDRESLLLLFSIIQICRYRASLLSLPFSSFFPFFIEFNNNLVF